MSDDADWPRRGFEGPWDIAVAEKARLEAMMGGTPPDIGAVRPEAGLPPFPWNVSGTRGMFAVWVRPGVDLPVPDGMDEARESIVGGLVQG